MIGHKLRDARVKAGLTLKEFSELVKIPFQHLSILENELYLNRLKDYFKPQAKQEKREPKSAGVWKYLYDEHKELYKIEPVRNQQINIILCELVDKFGEINAKNIIMWFYDPENKSHEYFKKRQHDPKLLRSQAYSLHNEIKVRLSNEQLF